MKKLIIRGGRKLKGEVKISGAKNAALPLMAATLLTEGKNSFSNIPQLRDIRTFAELMRKLGVEIKGKSALQIDASRLNSYEAPYELVKTMRASVLVLGPLVARMGKARVSLPGGCAIGPRPVDLHLKALESMGVKIKLEKGYIVAECRKLKGAKIYFNVSTVTGTENIMLAATLAKGTTVIKNAAKEPEVEELARVLNIMGAKIEGAGNDVITIEGVKKLKSINHTIIPDRIEAGTYMIAAGITQGDITLLNCNLNHLNALIEKLEEIGLEVKNVKRGLRVIGHAPLKNTDVKTLPYPGFPTDMQAQMMALLCLSNGSSIISETIFEDRFMHVGELKRMGADIRLERNSAVVNGVKKLKGAPVMATDLRASASLVLAGLAARGITEVSRIYHLDRGYELMEEKLSRLGANIKRVGE
ncbi:MAG: UDP-N-acetylglucosamine 1-carboxyvinyltransferase [Thermodesulfobacteriota bacterium]|jgi:UDP-N-acetylglucosamine 1-carboxyvinyltransferase|nr:UDP-N-acetylglucosamine 1-carboxyvinyltransferase [Deltaproteobacteria bacterium]